MAGARRVAQRHGWPLEVVEHAGDDPPIERPEAFLRGLHGMLERMA